MKAGIEEKVNSLIDTERCEEAFELIKEDFLNNDPDVKHLVGKLLFYATQYISDCADRVLGINHSKNDIMDWLKIGADLGCSDSMYYYAMFDVYEDGSYGYQVPESNEKLQYFESAIELGHGKACVELGKIYQTKPGRESQEKSLELFRKGVEFGDNSANLYYAMQRLVVDTGDGIKEIITKLQACTQNAHEEDLYNEQHINAGVLLDCLEWYGGQSFKNIGEYSGIIFDKFDLRVKATKPNEDKKFLVPLLSAQSVLKNEIRPLSLLLAPLSILIEDIIEINNFRYDAVDSVIQSMLERDFCKDDVYNWCQAVERMYYLIAKSNALYGGIHFSHGVESFVSKKERNKSWDYSLPKEYPPFVSRIPLVICLLARGDQRLYSIVERFISRELVDEKEIAKHVGKNAPDSLVAWAHNYAHEHFDIIAYHTFVERHAVFVSHNCIDDCVQKVLETDAPRDIEGRFIMFELLRHAPSDSIGLIYEIFNKWIAHGCFMKLESEGDIPIQCYDVKLPDNSTAPARLISQLNKIADHRPSRAQHVFMLFVEYCAGLTVGADIKKRYLGWAGLFFVVEQCAEWMSTASTVLDSIRSSFWSQREVAYRESLLGYLRALPSHDSSKDEREWRYSLEGLKTKLVHIKCSSYEPAKGDRAFFLRIMSENPSDDWLS